MSDMEFWAKYLVLSDWEFNHYLLAVLIPAGVLVMIYVGKFFVDCARYRPRYTCGLLLLWLVCSLVFWGWVFQRTDEEFGWVEGAWVVGGGEVISLVIWTVWKGPPELPPNWR